MNSKVYAANQKILNSFLEIRPIPIEHQVAPWENLYGYIYCIENKTSHKCYIGSAASDYSGCKCDNPNSYNKLRKRATNYIYEYNWSKRNKSSARSYNRPIIQAIVNEGFDNFVMYPIAETTKLTHDKAELYFINKYDSIANGYNVVNMGNREKSGHPMADYEKAMRSDPIMSINANAKKIIFSDSMKLFADYMNSTKDMIKNSVRKGRPYKGWFSFYCDPGKRQEVLEKFILNPEAAKSLQHSPKSIAFYKEMYDLVNKYMHADQAERNELFSDFEFLPPNKYDLTSRK